MTQTNKQKNAAAGGPQLHFIQKVIGSDTYLVMADSATRLEDEFSNLYYTANENSKVVLMPPFEPKVLASLVTKNNILSQCIEAMEVNIDGTGHEFVAIKEGEKGDEKEIELLNDFFNEPYPGESFLTQRRALRRQLESVGYAALEPLRNLEGDVVAVRNLDSFNLRFIKLDDAVLVPKTVKRAGLEITLQVLERERRFMQRLGNRYIYYREFGTTRECNKDTGLWAKEGETIPPELRATELIMFEVNPDVNSPYGVPRWINQLPSVVGSRKAEEQNLEYFDAGGLPPAIIFIQGGTLAKDAADQLKGYLSGKNKNKNRAVVVEAQSSSGSLESAGSVQVKVERFGAEKANDSMYQTYDKNAEEHVRVAFRLPPLFLGKAADYNYATAVVAYMVAEEQVFQPERSDFDEKINKTILKAMGIKTVKYQSKPITLKNVDAQLKAMDMVLDKVNGEGLIDEVNKLAGTDLKYEKPAEPPKPGPGQQFHPTTGEVVAVEQPATPAKPTRSTLPGDGGDGSLSTSGSGAGTPPATKSASVVVDLAHKYAQSRGLIARKSEMSPEEQADLTTAVAALGKADKHAFNSIVAGYAFKDTDDTDLVELAGCAHHG